jgi:hypothetical protein
VAKNSKPTASAQAPLQYHPFADIFPLMKGKEFEELVADIKARGLTEPIVTYKGKVLDGRNRDRACAAAGVKPRYLPFNGTDDDARAFVISANIRRRHLTASQKRALIKKVLKQSPETSDRQIAKTVGASPTTVAKVRGESTVQTGQLKTRTGADGKKRKLPDKKTRKKPESNPYCPGSPSWLAWRDARGRPRDSRTRDLVDKWNGPSITTNAVDPATAEPAAGEKPSYRELELKIAGLESEIEDLKKAPRGSVSLIDAVKAVIDSDASEWGPLADIRPRIIKAMKPLLADLRKFATPAPSSTEAPPSNSNGQWQVKPNQYLNGWAWFATNGSVSLNSKPGALFETEEEARADARAAIERAGSTS